MSALTLKFVVTNVAFSTVVAWLYLLDVDSLSSVSLSLSLFRFLGSFVYVGSGGKMLASAGWCGT